MPEEDAEARRCGDKVIWCDCGERILADFDENTYFMERGLMSWESTCHHCEGIWRCQLDYGDAVSHNPPIFTYWKKHDWELVKDYGGDWRRIDVKFIKLEKCKIWGTHRMTIHYRRYKFWEEGDYEAKLEDFGRRYNYMGFDYEDWRWKEYYDYIDHCDDLPYSDEYFRE